MTSLAGPNPPHGGKLIPLLVAESERAALLEEARKLPSLNLTQRQVCDLEMLLNGGFSPLYGFLNQDDYDRVVNEMRLVNGLLWPMPITLDVSQEEANSFKLGDKIALRDSDGSILAVINVESIWQPDKKKEAEKVFGSPDDIAHPSIEYLFNQAGSHYIGGTVRGVQLPVHYDYADLRLTPVELRAKLEKLGWRRVVGFQTRNPMHRSHRELTLKAARQAKANVLIHPVVGMTKPGDVDHYTRVRCYKEIMKYYPSDMATLSLLPLAMRMAGPKEALWHSIIRKNYGCSHFIIGRDHAGPGNNSKGEPFYDPYEAQRLVESFSNEIGITILKYNQVCYIEELGEYRCDDDIPKGVRVLNISGTELRRRLFMGIDIPEWFSFPSVVQILRQTHPPRRRQGFTLFFTGLSGSGKSTIANAVRIALLEEGSRPITLLDGDEVRTHLSTELGFSKEHRELNIRRIAYVASEITKARGVALTAAIAPYRSTRDFARKLISNYGGFIEIHVSTSLEVCESRDRKGLYAKARQGIVKQFTGISDPYEAPEKPEIVIDTAKCDVLQAVHDIMLYLKSEGYLNGTD